jgi:hypothetical protein
MIAAIHANVEGKLPLLAGNATRMVIADPLLCRCLPQEIRERSAVVGDRTSNAAAARCSRSPSLAGNAKRVFATRRLSAALD